MEAAGETLAFLEIPDGSSWSDSQGVIAALEHDFLPAFLERARWFPRGAGARIKPTILACLPFIGDSTIFALVETGEGERFLLPLRADWDCDAGTVPERSIVAPLRQGARGGLLRDVAADPVFVQRLLDHLQREVTIISSGWRIDFKPTRQFGGPSRHPLRVRAIEGEQSNSTVLVDQDYVIKLYRRIEPGENPEIEMGRFLTETAEFAHTPALLGYLEATHGATTYALGIVHALVPNRGDAWKWSADRIDMFLEAVIEGSEERDKALTARRDYMQWVRRLGCRVAEMHRGLASSDDNAAFKPERIDSDDLEFWIGDVRRRAARVCRRLGAAELGASDRPLVERLLQIEPALHDLAAGLIRPSLGRCKIRHHGDLHLGQVLVSGDDAVIIDFEGEPSRPMHERRRKAPAARDVAGLLRSLDYAEMAARQKWQASDRLTGAALRALGSWRDQSMDAFLGSYKDAMGSSDLWPDSAEDKTAMLSFFLLEKALYELEYELTYRPGWIALPLQGILRVLKEENIAPAG